MLLVQVIQPTKVGVLLGEDIGVTVGNDRKLVAAVVGQADGWSLADVPGPRGVGDHGNMKVPPVEDGAHGRNPRLPLGGGGCESHDHRAVQDIDQSVRRKRELGHLEGPTQEIARPFDAFV